LCNSGQPGGVGRRAGTPTWTAAAANVATPVVTEFGMEEAVAYVATPIVAAPGG